MRPVQSWQRRRGALQLAGIFAVVTSACAPEAMNETRLAASRRLFFIEASRATGMASEHGYPAEDLAAYYSSSITPQQDLAKMIGGVAASDFDRDGWVDLFVVTGSLGPDRLLRNRGDGSFEDVTEAYGVAGAGFGAGSAFADLDGDGYPELLVAGIFERGLRIYRNQAGRGFEEYTASSGITSSRPVVGTGIGDFDADGDLDLVVARWGQYVSPDEQRAELFWVNRGDGVFDDRTDLFAYSGADLNDGRLLEFALVPNFADIDQDGYPDALIVSDFNTTSSYRNVATAQGRGFSAMPSDVYTEDNGMSSALADYDNDGDLDWFVSSIEAQTAFGYDNHTGNRLYENRDGQFVDVTERAGVRDGSWAWASCAADFDNDGFIDIFHVNGWGYESPETQRSAREFLTDQSRLFLNNGDGSFRNVASDVGIVDQEQGRATACFDYDRDGDIDLFVGNVGARHLMYQNQLDPLESSTDSSHFLNVRLRASGSNLDAVGARIYLTAGGSVQMREIRIENGYLSQSPPEAHFGLGELTRVEQLRVVWPLDPVTKTRPETVLRDLAVDQQHIVER